MLRFIGVLLLLSSSLYAGPLFPTSPRRANCLGLLGATAQVFDGQPETVRKAARRLQEFRFDTLGFEGGVVPHAYRVRANARTGGLLKDQIAGRIRGVEKDVLSGWSDSEKRMAVILKGESEIQAFAKLLDDVLAQASMGVPWRGESIRDALILVLSAVFVVGAMQVDVGWPETLRNLAMAGALVETWLAMDDELDIAFPRRNRRIQKPLSGKTPEWFFDGDTLSVNEMEARLSTTSDFTHRLILPLSARQSFWRSFPFVRWWWQHAHPPADMWVSWDRLYYADPETGQPTVVLVIRSARWQPWYAPAPAPAAASEAAPVPHLAPGT